MKPRLVAILAVLVLCPLGGLAWIGVRYAQDEQAEVAARFDAVVRARLDDVTATVARVVETRERGLLALAQGFPVDPDDIRRLARVDPRFNQVLVFGSDGRLVFPPPEGPVSEDERTFLERTRDLWEGRGGSDPARPAAPVRLDGRGGPETPAPAGGQSHGEENHGWHHWYWGGGLNLLFWQRLADGRLVAFELERVRLLADVVAALPTGGGDDERTVLLDSSGRPVYQWGGFDPSGGEAPRLTRPLAAPLQPWQLAWSGVAPAPGGGMSFNLLGGLLAVGLALTGLAAWFYRESSHEIRRAAQRVTFVNQVSHELKTPLTNIRMYAELLEEELGGEDERADRYLGIIARESQRLSRLIGNILSFARQQRETLTIRRAPAVLDEVVRDVLDQFGPSLRQAGVVARFEPGAPTPIPLDADAAGQVLGNLLSNVEKYAPGAEVRVATRQAGDRVTLAVADAGPGVPRAHRARIFDPFHRVSDALTDGVTGTGIGLGIARELCRQHGGDLVLLETERGACFEAWFPIAGGPIEGGEHA